jgi:hypothetical protein
MAMATQEYMADVTKYLAEHTTQQGIPVTEVIVFKLKDASEANITKFEKEIFDSSKLGAGAPRTSWGRSLTDPSVLVWMIDWDKIEYHWDFWQTDAFPPLMAAINDLCVGGNPLVKHYRFEPRGFVDTPYIQLLVWDETEKRDGAAIMSEIGQDEAVQRKGAYAIDFGSESWFCALLGYDSEEKAMANKVDAIKGGESHIAKLDVYVQQ